MESYAIIAALYFALWNNDVLVACSVGDGSILNLYAENILRSSKVDDNLLWLGHHKLNIYLADVLNYIYIDVIL